MLSYWYPELPRNTKERDSGVFSGKPAKNRTRSVKRRPLRNKNRVPLRGYAAVTGEPESYSSMTRLNLVEISFCSMACRRLKRFFCVT